MKTNREKLVNYIMENVEEGLDAVREINGYDGSLGYLDYWENDEEFFNCYFEGNPMEAVRATYYGEYKYNDEYVKINAYGNLESCSRYDLLNLVKENAEEIADRMINLYDNLCLSEEIEDILNDEDNTED